MENTTMYEINDKKEYQEPVLSEYGTIESLTNGSGGGLLDSDGFLTATPSQQV